MAWHTPTRSRTRLRVLNNIWHLRLFRAHWALSRLLLLKPTSVPWNNCMSTLGYREDLIGLCHTDIFSPLETSKWALSSGIGDEICFFRQGFWSSSKKSRCLSLRSFTKSHLSQLTLRVGLSKFLAIGDSPALVLRFSLIPHWPQLSKNSTGDSFLSFISAGNCALPWFP
jgi:hypothetical protein